MFAKGDFTCGGLINSRQGITVAAGCRCRATGRSERVVGIDIGVVAVEGRLGRGKLFLVAQRGGVAIITGGLGLGFGWARIGNKRLLPLKQRVFFEFAFDERSQFKIDSCSNLIACCNCGVMTGACV